MAALSAAPATAQERPRVIAVSYVLQEFAERLMGDDGEVEFPVPEGVDPSFWRPSIADISRIQSADLILLNGAGFATWVDRVSLPRARLSNTSAAIEDQFIVTESITHSHGDGTEHSHEGLAAYTWLDPVLAAAQAEAIADAIVARDLALEEDVGERLTALHAELEALDEAAKEALSGAQNASLIATHPRYQYFARRYDLSITSLEWEAGAAPSDTQLAGLERLAADLDARVLIWEAAPPQDAIDAVEALGLKSVVFEPSATLREAGSFVESYANAVSEIGDALNAASN